jgi:hypothetical protein
MALSISEPIFNELYPDLVGHYKFFNEPPPAGISTSEFERLYLSNKLWRLNNVYSIVDKHARPITFVMNHAQHIVYAKTRQHPRLIILKSRQQGISTFWLVSYFDDAIWAPFMNVGLMAQGNDEAATLLERAKFLWDSLDDSVKQFADVRLEKDNTKVFSFSNKSTMFIRVSFRSTTLQRLHVSEMGKIANNYPKRAKEVKTGTLQALAPGNTGVIESTAEGKNMFKAMWDASIISLKSGQMAPKDFYPIFLSWLNDPDCVSDIPQVIHEVARKYFEDLETATGYELTEQQKNFWIIQYRELGADVLQEYPGTPEEAFTASRDGTYYSKLFNSKVVRLNGVIPDLHDKNLHTDVYVDLGVDDYFVLVFVQWYKNKWRVVGEYYNNGYSLAHYMDYIRDSEFDVRAVRFPHDVRVRELGSSSGGGRAKSRYDVVMEYKKLNNLAWRIDVLPRTSVENGIEAVRRIIPHLVIDAKCTYLISCFLNYSKEWDEKLQCWKTTPLHNQYSHGADAMRQLAGNTIENVMANPSKLALQSRKPSNRGFAL